MAGRFIDLQTRLEGLREEPQRKLSFFFGSGLSNATLPSTALLADTFLALLKPAFQEEVRTSDNGRKGAPGLYQEAAKLVALHKGDLVIARVIREAVLSAYRGDTSRLEITGRPGTYDEAALHDLTMSPGLWNIPSGYRSFAKFFKSIPAEFRGRVLTTNFDPFIEMALAQAGLEAEPETLDFDNPPSVEASRFSRTEKVVHLHGYFASTFGVNTIGQLERVRPNTENYLQQLLQGHSVVVAGYGGWNDAFTRMLWRDSSYRTLTDAEVLWSTFDGNANNALDVPIIAELDGRPGFHLFVGVDAGELFVTADTTEPLTAEVLLPRGYTSVEGVPLIASLPISFAEGAQPTWTDAANGTWPLLSPGKQLYDLVAEGSKKLVAAVGPIAEGKSTALKQVAWRLANETESCRVIWREAGASPAADEALGNMDFKPKTLIVIDDVESAVPLLRRLIRVLEETDIGLRVMVACHDRHWASALRFAHGLAHVVKFGDLEEQDADAITRTWDRYNIFPESSSSQEVLASALLQAAHGNPQVDGSSLFGAILAVREAATLNERIGALMRSLDAVTVSRANTITLTDVFGSICVQQHFLDAANTNAKGATRKFLSELIKGDEAVLDETVLFRLGREAALTFSGERVYARHPAIATAVVAWLEDNQRLGSVCEKTAFAGATLRQAGLVSTDDYDAYMLPGSMPTYGLAVAAGRGAMLGAPKLLEARVNYISTIRRLEQYEDALLFARGTASNLGRYRDWRTATRGLLTEAHLLLEADYEPGLGLGAAALSLHDPLLPYLKPIQAQRGLVAICRLADKLVLQGDKNAGPVLFFAHSLLIDRFGPTTLALRTNPTTPKNINGSLSGAALSTALAQAASPYARKLLKDWDLPFGPTVRGEWQLPFNNYIEYTKLGAI